MTSCMNCGHLKKDHIYEEGACRPGYICPSHCEKYISHMEPRELYILIDNETKGILRCEKTPARFVFDPKKDEEILFREVLPNEPDYKALAQELVKGIEPLIKVWLEFGGVKSVGCYIDKGRFINLHEALDKARKAGIE